MNAPHVRITTIDAQAVSKVLYASAHDIAKLECVGSVLQLMGTSELTVDNNSVEWVGSSLSEVASFVAKAFDELWTLCGIDTGRTDKAVQS